MTHSPLAMRSREFNASPSLQPQTIPGTLSHAHPRLGMASTNIDLAVWYQSQAWPRTRPSFTYFHAPHHRRRLFSSSLRYFELSEMLPSLGLLVSYIFPFLTRSRLSSLQRTKVKEKWKLKRRINKCSPVYTEILMNQPFSTSGKAALAPSRAPPAYKARRRGASLRHNES